MHDNPVALANHLPESLAYFHSQELTTLIQKVSGLAQDFLGFQTSQHVQFDPALYPLLNLNLLNIGDAYTDGNFRVNSKHEERQVLDFYARHWCAPQPEHPNTAGSYWGYLTTMGSTEGNLFGLWNARDYLAGGELFFADSPASQHKHKPAILLTGRDTHYSVAKAAHILAIPLPSAFGYKNNQGENAPDFIASDVSGAIDIEQLVSWADYLFAQGHPLIFALNIGSTFKGAFDPIQQIIARLPKVFAESTTRNYWIHIDAAICGNTLPWIEHAQQQSLWSGELQENAFPHFDFRIPHVSSICASPYKWIGAPWPFGIYLTRGKFRLQPSVHPKYIGSPDSTFSGSRNGLAAVYSWHYFAGKTAQDHVQDVTAIQTIIDYAYQQLNKLQGQITIDGREFRVIPPHYLSPIICFTRPADVVVKTYSLPSEESHLGEICHVVILKHVTVALIDKFIQDLIASADYHE